MYVKLITILLQPLTSPDENSILFLDFNWLKSLFCTTEMYFIQYPTRRSSTLKLIYAKNSCKRIPFLFQRKFIGSFTFFTQNLNFSSQYQNTLSFAIPKYTQKYCTKISLQNRKIHLFLKNKIDSTREKKNLVINFRMSSDVIQKDFVYWYVTRKKSESQPLYSIQYNTKKKSESMPSICLKIKKIPSTYTINPYTHFYPDSNHITSETSSTSVDLNYIFLRFTSMCTTKCSNFRRQYEKTDIIYTLSNRQWKWGKAWQKKAIETNRNSLQYGNLVEK